MKKSSKILSLLLALVMVVGVLSLTACGKKSSNDKKETTVADNTEKATEESTDKETEPETDAPVADKKDLKDMTAVEFAREMGNGINLGNTMEAFGRAQYGTDGLMDLYEKSWGQPITTAEMIKGMKDAGFDTIRIPVAWTNKIKYEDGDYTIGQELIDRIKEIVDYAYAADMFVIVNDHWDGGWWGMFGQEDEKIRDAAMEMYKSMWTQIATTFADYDNHLIFESANEELGSRLNDAIDGNKGVLTVDEQYEKTLEINQTFVDTVRACGSNNEDRYLLIAGFNTDVKATMDDRYKMPTDKASDKLMLSIHFYEPWDYCGDDGSSNAWGTITNLTDMNDRLATLTKYTDAGIPVVMGEYGVLNLIDDKEKTHIVSYMTNLLDNCDLYGIVPVLWETGALYSKTDCKMKFDDTAEMFLNRSRDKQASMTAEEEKEAAVKNMKAALDAAPESLAETDYTPGDEETVISTIMWQNGSWGNGYSVGDKYAPDTSSGIVPTEVEITGEGTYKVGLDFSACGDNKGTVFSALAIYNGEIKFPGYSVENMKVYINGEEFTLLDKYATSSDNDICTRVNLYNQWVSPGDYEDNESARRADGKIADASPWIIENPDGEGLGNTQVTTLEVEYDFVAPENFESYLADRDAWAASVAK